MGTRRPISGPDDHRHGRPSGYLAGCKEPCCREAARASKAAWRARMRLDPPPPGDYRHGRASTYGDYGCRCVPCTRAASAASRDYRSGSEF